MRKWADEATKTAVWEVYKFIYINTVAPLGTFKPKSESGRKWYCNISLFNRMLNNLTTLTNTRCLFYNQF
ncbi:hypothetical protein [Gemella sp.]